MFTTGDGRRTRWRAGPVGWVSLGYHGSGPPGQWAV